MAQHVINTHATSKSPSPLPLSVQQYARCGSQRKASPASPAPRAEPALSEAAIADVRKKKRPETRGRQVVPTDQNIDGEEPQYALNATIT
jgi:hypothetical protein